MPNVKTLYESYFHILQNNQISYYFIVLTDKNTHTGDYSLVSKTETLII